jgi:hypothetical protein
VEDSDSTAPASSAVREETANGRRQILFAVMSVACERLAVEVREKRRILREHSRDAVDAALCVVVAEVADVFQEREATGGGRLSRVCIRHLRGRLLHEYRQRPKPIEKAARCASVDLHRLVSTNRLLAQTQRPLKAGLPKEAAESLRSIRRREQTAGPEYLGNDVEPLESLRYDRAATRRTGRRLDEPQTPRT